MTTTGTLVQCDFDGTVTEEDVSYMLLDTFASGNWRERLKEYEGGRISVGRFNTEAFSMVKADRATLIKMARNDVKIRSGFSGFVDYCREKGLRLVIVSNGLDFYIKEILQSIGAGDIEIFAARTTFRPGALEVQYVGPDGRCLDDDFKGAYVASFLKEGYRIIYIGNGASDLKPAKLCHYVFATGTLLAQCQQTKVNCLPFDDFTEIVKEMETLP